MVEIVTMKKLSERKKKRIERTIANNRSYKLYLYNRLFIFILLVLGQLVGFIFLAYLFVRNTKAGVLVQGTVELCAILAVVNLIGKNDRPSLKWNWILLMLLMPVIGVPSYILYGEGRPTRQMRKVMSKVSEENDRAFIEFYGKYEVKKLEKREQSLAHYLATYAKYPTYSEGDVVYYKAGEEMYPAMLEALQTAKKFILLDYFIISHGKMWNSILQILLEKAELGVQIRIIYDDFGCMVTLPPKYDKYLESLHENIILMLIKQKKQRKNLKI